MEACVGSYFLGRFDLYFKELYIHNLTILYLQIEDWYLSGKKNLAVGDLVTHVLYGRGWIGVICDFRKENSVPTQKRDVQALVQIQPGTEFDGFFKRSSSSDRVNENLGYVTVHWLFKVKERDGNFRPSRNETPGS